MLVVMLCYLATGCVGSVTFGEGDDEGTGGAGADAPDGGAVDGGQAGDAGTEPDADLTNYGEGEPTALGGITAAHNAARADKGVAPLTWDAELAVVAQSWADQCINNDGNSIMDHNAGRSANYPGYVGENIYASGGPPSPSGAVALWVAEEQYYDYASNTCSGVCGHYTQVVWAASQKLGCGVSNCPSIGYPNTIVCNYSPGGNAGGQRPY